MKKWLSSEKSTLFQSSPVHFLSSGWFHWNIVGRQFNEDPIC